MICHEPKPLYLKVGDNVVYGDMADLIAEVICVTDIAIHTTYGRTNIYGWLLPYNGSTYSTLNNDILSSLDFSTPRMKNILTSRFDRLRKVI